MLYLYYINLLIFIPLMFLTTNLVLKKFNWNLFSLPGFILLTTLPVVFLKRFGSLFINLVSIDNKYYQFSILMDNIYLTIILIKTYYIIKYLNVIQFVFFMVMQKLPIKLNSINLFRENTKWLYSFSLTLYVIFFLLLTNTNTNTIEWISNPRNGYQLYREGAGHWYALSIIFLGINSVLYFIYRVKKQEFIFAIIIYSYLWFLFGGKAYILYLFSLILVSITINFSKNILKVFFFSSIFISFSLVALLFFANQDEILTSDSLDSVFSYFDHYHFSTLYYEDYFSGRISLYYGKIFFTNFYKYIPRVLFSDKPYVYGSILLNELYLPGYAEMGITPEFAGQAPLFADFGIIGVIILNLIDLDFLFSSISLLIVYNSISTFNLKKEGKFLFCFIFSLAPAFSQFFTFPFNIIILIFVLIFSNYFYVKHFYKY